MHQISEILCEVYKALYERGEVSFTLQEEQKARIDSVVKTVNAQYFGIERFSPTTRKAAAYFCLIIKDHPVIDGNKRLAVIWVEIYCSVSGLTLHSLASLDELALGVEASSMPMDELVVDIEKALFGNPSPP